MLENSKCQTKDLLKKLRVPVPPCQNFSDPQEAKEYVQQRCSEEPGRGLVIKADGLAAERDPSSAPPRGGRLRHRAHHGNPRLFGEAGDRIEIEDRLEGRELMFFALSDGHTVQAMQSALDYKQAFSPDESVAIRLFNKLAGNPNQDNNPNTGGMGGFSPHPWLDEELTERIMKKIALPTVRGFKESSGQEYRGVIYFGLMISEDGSQQSSRLSGGWRPRGRGDTSQAPDGLLPAFHAVWMEGWMSFLCNGQTTSAWAYAPYPPGDQAPSSTARRGPLSGEHYTNMPINGLERVDPEVIVYHNGTAWERLAGNRRLYTTPRRVFTLVAGARACRGQDKSI